MIEKCYYYCSYNDSRNGYESTKVQFKKEMGKYVQFSLTSEDVKDYLEQLCSFTGNIKLYKNNSSNENEAILIINNIQELLPENTNIRDKYISIMICSNSEEELTHLTLALISNTKEIVQLIYDDSVILKQNKASNNSYTIDGTKINKLNEYANFWGENFFSNEDDFFSNKMSGISNPLIKLIVRIVRKMIKYFKTFYLSETVDINTASYYLSKNPKYKRFKNDEVFKVLEKVRKEDKKFSLFQILKRNTLIIPRELLLEN